MADYLTNTETIGKVGNIKTVADEHPEKIEIHLPAAKKEMLDIIGSEKYTELFEGEESDDKSNAVLAESYYALMFIMPAINTESSGTGVTKATGFGESRKENLSEYDLNAMIERYRDNAVSLLSGLRLTKDTDADDYPNIVNTSKIQMICPGGVD